jgi:uncharacterized membrane protein YcjF (UPF0283 family)
MNETSEIEKELEAEITNRHRYARFDFILNHILVGIAVVASSYPAYAQIFDKSDAKTIAAIAAIPAFILLLQKTFKWEQRAEWHWDYKRKITAIKRQLRDQGLKPEAASQLLTKIETDLSGTFPGVNLPKNEK